MTEFTATCNKPYDRHEYAITFSNGRQQLFGDYVSMRNFWFTHCHLSKMTAEVTDVSPIEMEPEEEPRFLKGLYKLTQRKSPWEGDECTHST